MQAIRVAFKAWSAEAHLALPLQKAPGAHCYVSLELRLQDCATGMLKVMSAKGMPRWSQRHGQSFRLCFSLVLITVFSNRTFSVQTKGARHRCSLRGVHRTWHSFKGT